MTICNAGSIATSRYGTALAPFYLAKQKDLGLHIYACETRPVLQGSRLTAWELMQGGIDVTLITDSMAAHTMKENKFPLSSSELIELQRTVIRQIKSEHTVSRF